MSAIDNSEITGPIPGPQQDEHGLADVIRTNATTTNAETYRIRKPKRVLHFSDGTLEEYETDEDEEEDCDSSTLSSNKPKPVPVNPKLLSWPGWFQHYTSKSAKKTLDVLDSAGETVAYYLGITTPKYQYEIDEYKRMQEEEEAKKKQREEELASWGTTTGIAGAQSPPITTQDRIPGIQLQPASGSPSENPA